MLAATTRVRTLYRASPLLADPAAATLVAATATAKTVAVIAATTAATYYLTSKSKALVAAQFRNPRVRSGSTRATRRRVIGPPAAAILAVAVGAARKTTRTTIALEPITMLATSL